MAMRIDKLLWFLRLAASRSFAQTWVEAGHMRINGRRIEKASCQVQPGDVLTLPMRTQVRVIEIVALPARRGPASEAQACYQVLSGASLTGTGAESIAAAQTVTPQGINSP